jgi:hypothetical protein
MLTTVHVINYGHSSVKSTKGKKVTEINKALGVCRINIYHSLDNVLHCIYHAI